MARPIPSAFFFLNLFAHIALPIGMALGLWIHVSRLARPQLLPPRALLWATLALLFVASALVPAPLGPKADPGRLPGEVPLDLFYAFWLPASRALAPGPAWLAFGAGAVLVLSVPWWTRPRSEARPAPSFVDPSLCTGCEQCSIDCPFDAIAMVPVTTNAAGRAALVDHLLLDVGRCEMKDAGRSGTAQAPAEIRDADPLDPTRRRMRARLRKRVRLHLVGLTRRRDTDPPGALNSPRLS